MVTFISTESEKRKKKAKKRKKALQSSLLLSHVIALDPISFLELSPAVEAETTISSPPHLGHVVLDVFQTVKRAIVHYLLLAQDANLRVSCYDSGLYSTPGHWPVGFALDVDLEDLSNFGFAGYSGVNPGRQ